MTMALEFVDLQIGPNPDGTYPTDRWRATMTRAEVLAYADRKMMPRWLELSSWHDARKRLARAAEKSRLDCVQSRRPV